MQQANLVNSAAEAGASGTSGAAGGGGAPVSGGRFDFDDGGTFCGGWEDGKAHGHGVCTGPKGQGAYSGSWHYGFEVSGVYTWPSGSSFEGQWQNGKRHGLGVEARGRWLYRGEWTQGFKGRYGVRQSATSNAKYEGTWANGLQDGYGSETYADGGTYQGQWLRGMRHGYGVRASAPFGLASHYRPNGKNVRASLTSLRSAGDTGGGGREAPTPDPAERRNHRMDDARGGFVLKARSDEPPARRNSLVEKTKKGLLSGLKMRKQRSTGDLEKRGTGSIRSTGSSASWVSTESSRSGVTNASLHTDSNASFVVEDEHLDSGVTETYMGEWKNDKRTGFGISERSDGLRYEGEWFANKKYGYGVTTFRDGTKEEGKYKNNVLITSQKKRHLFLIRSAKFRERIDAAVNAAQRASKIALQKADIAISRTATARGKAEQADLAADHAKEDSDVAQVTAKQFAPDFKQPGMDRLRIREKFKPPPEDAVPAKSILHPPTKSFDQPTVSNPNVLNPPPIPPKTTFASVRRPSEQYPKAVQPNDSSYPIPASAYATQNLPQTTPNQVSNSLPQSQNNNIQQPSYLKQQQGYQTQPGYQQTQSNYQQGGSNYQQPSMQQNTQQSQNMYQPLPNPSQTNYPQNSYSQQSTYPQFNNTTQQNNYNPQTQNYNQQHNSFGQQQQPPFQNMPNANQYSSFNQTQMSQNMDPYMNTMEQNRVPDLPNSIPPGATPMMNDISMQQSQMNNLSYGQSIRRNSRQVGGERPQIGNQSSIDHFDHYKRPPSRDSSVDRYARATGRMSLTGNSRQASVDKTGMEPVDRMARGSSQLRSGTPVSMTGNGAVLTGQGSRAATPVYTVMNQSSVGQNPPFEDVLLRKRNLGQDIIPSLAQPKRTESLYIGANAAPAPSTGGGGGGRGGGGGGGGGPKRAAPAPQPLQRKKSLPDVQGFPRAPDGMSREEVSMLGSARREEIRRMADESERLRANPLLYLVSPQVKEWFSRQQLVILVLFINISLAIMFFKLLT